MRSAVRIDASDPVTSAMTLYTVVKSRRLSEFLDALSDEQLGWREKMKALRNVWLNR